MINYLTPTHRCYDMQDVIEQDLEIKDNNCLYI